MADRSDPSRIFARQALRTALVSGWFDALGLGKGDTCVDLGCGAGYVALRAAERVGPEGTVHALDSDAEAIRFLGDLVALHGLGSVRPTVSPLAEMEPLPARPCGSILSMVLHHLREPAATLRHISECTLGAPWLLPSLPPTVPAGWGRHAPRATRVPPETLETVCRDAGLAVRAFQRQTAEHWFALVEIAD